MGYAGVEGDVRETIAHYVACGFDDPQTIYERVTETFEDEDEAEIDELIDAAVAAHDAAMAAWPAVTDCDRLDRAFAALETEGIVARQNFACCQNCGRAEIRDEIAGARRARRSVDGFVFYHMQDTDSAVTHGVLQLRYDGTLGNAATAIGTRVVAALREAGLAPAWDGDINKTIEVGLRWQRRAAPGVPAVVHTAATSVAAWCAALPAATLGAAAANAGVDFALALDAAGLTAAAMAWARAPFDDADRARSLARLAVARRSRALLVEAWQLVPWDAGAFVALLAEAGLAVAQVRTIACAKIQELPFGIDGSVAAAWLYACAPDIERAGERARREWTGQRPYKTESELLALAAGLWRAGDPLRDEVLSHFSSAQEWAQLAAISAAPTAEDALAFATELDVIAMPEPQRRRILARLVALGAVAAARGHAAEHGDPYVAYVAWLTEDTATLETLAANLGESAVQCDEGLITATELRDLRMAIAAGTAAREPVRARALLTGIAATACAAALAEAREAALAMLAGRPLDPHPGYADGPLAKTHPTLDAAIATWNPHTTKHRYRFRHASRTMLAHAAAFARKGKVARAQELLALVLAPLGGEDELDGAIQSAGIDDGIIAAWIALGDLARVEQFVHGELGLTRTLSCAAIGCYVPALIAAGEREHALALLGGAISGEATGRAVTRLELLDLIPAVLAVAGDAGEAVHAAWQRADDALATLSV